MTEALVVWQSFVQMEEQPPALLLLNKLPADVAFDSEETLFIIGMGFDGFILDSSIIDHCFGLFFTDFDSDPNIILFFVALFQIGGFILTWTLDF